MQMQQYGPPDRHDVFVQCRGFNLHSPDDSVHYTFSAVSFELIMNELSLSVSVQLKVYKTTHCLKAHYFFGLTGKGAR